MVLHFSIAFLTQTISLHHISHIYVKLYHSFRRILVLMCNVQIYTLKILARNSKCKHIHSRQEVCPFLKDPFCTGHIKAMTGSFVNHTCIQGTDKYVKTFHRLPARAETPVMKTIRFISRTFCRAGSLFKLPFLPYISFHLAGGRVGCTFKRIWWIPRRTSQARAAKSSSCFPFFTLAQESAREITLSSGIACSD